MSFQVTVVQKHLKGFDYPGGPNAVMQALSRHDELGGSTQG